MNASPTCQDESAGEAYGITTTRSPAAARIDTRLVSEVQRRAGARVHEAAGLLQAYYTWTSLLARAVRSDNHAMIETASPQVNAARVRLRRFLSDFLMAVG